LYVLVVFLAVFSQVIKPPNTNDSIATL